MKRLLALVICASFFTEGASQGQELSPDLLDTPALEARLADQASLLDLALTGDRLVAVGEHGIILARDLTDKVWQQQMAPVGVTLTAVAFNSIGVGLAVGHGGVILRSDDNGESWTRVADGRGLFRQVIDAARARYDALAAEIEVLVGADDATLSRLEDDLFEMAFRRETAEQSLQYGPSWPLLDVVFTDEDTVWSVGAFGMLFRSGNRGRSWELASDRIDNFDDLHLNALLQTGAGSLLIAGEAGVLIRSTDGGETFERFDSYDGLSIFGLAEAEGFIVAYGFGNTVQVSRDDGVNWDSVQLEENPLLIGDLSLGPDRVGLIGGSGLMVEFGPDGPIETRRPTGERVFLSAGVRLADGTLQLVSEAGVSQPVTE